MSEIIRAAIIYSCIAFSIVFIVLGGLTIVIYATRLAAGGSTPPSAPNSGAGKGTPAASAASAASGGAAPARAVAVDVKGQHVAAITAAILALTQGRGRILSVAPAQAQGCPSLTASRWRSAGIVESTGRRLAPSWKRYFGALFRA
jgi:hypothetical protein